mmetsp:Transcript_120066/g.245491  ORF Transcript_120066/g.245491 Transcript_120066/m.245491 type:complete len:80 (+) Transcript_120066:210-449(+)
MCAQSLVPFAAPIPRVRKDIGIPSDRSHPNGTCRGSSSRRESGQDVRDLRELNCGDETYDAEGHHDRLESLGEQKGLCA